MVISYESAPGRKRVQKGNLPPLLAREDLIDRSTEIAVQKKVNW